MFAINQCNIFVFNDMGRKPEIGLFLWLPDRPNEGALDAMSRLCTFPRIKLQTLGGNSRGFYCSARSLFEGGGRRDWHRYAGERQGEVELCTGT
jgi:hypothetical protein